MGNSQSALHTSFTQNYTFSEKKTFLFTTGIFVIMNRGSIHLEQQVMVVAIYTKRKPIGYIDHTVRIVDLRVASTLAGSFASITESII